MSSGRSDRRTSIELATIITVNPTSSTTDSDSTGRLETVAGESASTAVPTAKSSPLITITRGVGERSAGSMRSKR